jgi:hypothetical protein
MTSGNERYSRQLRLPEVGSQGQSAIGAGRLVVDATSSGEVARDYLLRAGARVTTQAGAPRPAFPHEWAFRFAAPREWAEGCARALLELRRLLGVGN